MINIIFYYVNILTVVLGTCILEENNLLGYQISYGVFEILSTVGMERCQTECFTRRKCQSIAYNKQTLECSFGKYTDNKTFTGVNTDIYIIPDWNNIPASLGPCRYGQCSTAQRCVSLSSGNFTCMGDAQPIDLTVLVDGSKTITNANCQLITSMVKRLIDLFDQNTWDLRLAFAFFHGSTDIKFGLDQYITKVSQKDAVDNVVYPDIGGNELGTALKDISNQIYSGSSGDRPGPQNVILVMLDPFDMSLTNLEGDADIVKATGTHIMAVGRTTTSAGLSVLHQIVSDPLADNSFTIASFDDLVGMETTILQAIAKVF